MTKDAPGGERRDRLGRWVGWSLVSGFALLALLRLEWTRALEVVGAASVPWMTVAVLANGAILLLWAAQWRVLLPGGREVSRRTMFRITAVTSTVANGGPPLTGHATGVHVLAAWGGLDYAGAVSVVALDQLMEGLAKLTLIGVVALATPLPPELRAVVGGLTLAVGALGAVLLVGAHGGGASWDLPLPSAARSGLLGRARDLLVRAAAQLDALRDPGVAARAFALAVAMKAAELGGILAAQAALGISVDLGGSLLVLAAVSLVTMVSVTPGNLGTYEAGAFGAYRWLDVDPGSALALALLQHLLFLIPATGTGWLLLTLRGGGRGRGSKALDEVPPSG